MEAGLKVLMDCPLSAPSMFFLLQDAKKRARECGLPDVAISSLVLDNSYLAQRLARSIEHFRLDDVSVILLSCPMMAGALHLFLRTRLDRPDGPGAKTDVFVTRCCLEVLRVQWHQTDFMDVLEQTCIVHEVALHQTVSLCNRIRFTAWPAGGTLGSAAWHIKTYAEVSVSMSPSFGAVAHLLLCRFAIFRPFRASTRCCLAKMCRLGGMGAKTRHRWTC
jgi:hypothetical protein